MTDGDFWLRLLEHSGVDHATSGPNVARGHVNIRCPLCPDDPSKHFGIRLADGAWACYRNPEHRGRSRIRLVKMITSCSGPEARRILEEGTVAVEVDLDGLLRDLEGESGARTDGTPRSIRWPPDFRPLTQGSWGRRALDYLEERGLLPADQVAETYDLRYAITGEFRYRIAAPIVVDGRRRGWTARAYVPARIRYRTFPKGEGVRDLIYNFDRCLEGGRTLFLVEGSMDAKKVDWYGEAHGVHAAGLLGVAAPPGKLELVARLVDRYHSTYLLLDAEATEQELGLGSKLSHLGVRLAELPQGVGDPGDLTPHSVARLARRYG